MAKMIITATDGVTTQSITLKSDVTIERAVELLEQLYDEDYLGLYYTLWVDDEEYMTLEC